MLNQNLLGLYLSRVDTNLTKRFDSNLYAKLYQILKIKVRLHDSLIHTYDNPSYSEDMLEVNKLKVLNDIVYQYNDLILLLFNNLDDFLKYYDSCIKTIDDIKPEIDFLAGTDWIPFSTYLKSIIFWDDELELIINSFILSESKLHEHIAYILTNYNNKKRIGSDSLMDDLESDVKNNVEFLLKEFYGIEGFYSDVSFLETKRNLLSICIKLELSYFGYYCINGGEKYDVDISYYDDCKMLLLNVMAEEVTDLSINDVSEFF